MAMREYLAEEIATDFADALLTRREALRRLALVGLSTSAAAALLAACGGSGGDGDESKTNKPNGTTATAAPATAESVRFPGPNGELQGAWAAASKPKGAVLVIHENRGLTDHIRSLPPRFAADGYSTLAIDLLSEEGGTAAVGGDAEATGALSQAPADRLVTDLRAGVDELERRAPRAKLAAVGFCFGGGLTWQLLAAGEPRLAAAVPFYGPAPENPDFSKSKAAVLGVYAELDARVNATRDAAAAALQAAGLTHEIRTFPGVDHAFFNDTGPRYNAAVAAEAYQAVLAWFAAHLQ
jgi:carboxymethylenebutenolidase